MTTNLKYYRVIIFLIGACYWLNIFSLYGIAIFRYLTNWGLTFSVICASLLCCESCFKQTLRINALVIATFCLNAVIMVLYWKLYFKNPDLLYAGASHLPWYRDDYVHFISPMGQMIDALFFKRAFNGRVLKGLTYFFIVTCIYNISAELIFSLPYPFLWDLDLNQRLAFYTQAYALGLVACLFGMLLSRKMISRKI